MPERVSSSLRLRVEDAVAKLGYVPNASAKALATLRTGVVAIMVSDLARWATLVSVVIARLASYGFATRIVECPSAGSAVAFPPADTEVEGVIVLGMDLSTQSRDLLARRRTPWVEMSVDGSAASCGVFVDLATTAATVASYLAQLGHRSAILLQDPMDCVIGQAWLKALAAALPAASVGAQHCDGVGTLAPMAERLMAIPEHTAVLCTSDVLALRAMSTLERATAIVPGNMSVVGWGDASFARYLAMPLTTIRVPWQAAGEALVDVLFGIRGGGAGRAVRIVPKLVVRRSCDAAVVSRETNSTGFT